MDGCPIFRKTAPFKTKRVRHPNAAERDDLGEDSLEFGVFGLGLFEGGDVGVGVFPGGEEILVGGAGLWRCRRRGRRRGRGRVGRGRGKISLGVEVSIIEDLLEIGGSGRPVFLSQKCLAAYVDLVPDQIANQIDRIFRKARECRELSADHHG